MAPEQNAMWLQTSAASCFAYSGGVGYGFPCARTKAQTFGKSQDENKRCGRGSAGRASPCQGEGRGFESRRPLGERLAQGHGSRETGSRVVGWPRGEATDCKSVYTGSNPVPTSFAGQLNIWAVGAVVARFLDTEEVTGSNPVSPTNECGPDKQEQSAIKNP